MGNFASTMARTWAILLQSPVRHLYDHMLQQVRRSPASEDILQLPTPWVGVAQKTQHEVLPRKT